MTPLSDLDSSFVLLHDDRIKTTKANNATTFLIYYFNPLPVCLKWCEMISHLSFPITKQFDKYQDNVTIIVILFEESYFEKDQNTPFCFPDFYHRLGTVLQTFLEFAIWRFCFFFCLSSSHHLYSRSLSTFIFQPSFPHQRAGAFFFLSWILIRNGSLFYPRCY